MITRKRAASVTAGVLSAAILLTGTFAWRSISQEAKNEIVRVVNPGGRLHDDFDGESKDVYVENFMKKGEGGQPIFARVRLDEYMETGKNAGSRDPAKRGDLNILAMSSKNPAEKAKIDDVTTWRTHIPNDDADPFHNYWEWTTGGETVFMPTFNKNKDSLSADVNGTWEGKVAGDYDHFDDYVEYTEGQKIEKMAYYDLDETDTDEYDPLNPGDDVPGAGGDKDVNYRESKETHEARKTLNATVMTMADWIDADMPMGPIWVYDEDGWAYWAQAIDPGEATGLLLDGIDYINDDQTPCYYGINVVAQFATKDECKLPDSSTTGDPCDYIFDPAGKAENAPSARAKLLLKQAMGIGYAVTVTTDGGVTEVAPGGDLTLKANVKVGVTETEGSGDAAPAQAVTWSLSGAKSRDTKIDAKGKLHVGDDEREDTVLTVRAKTWNRVLSDPFTVTVKAAAAPTTPDSGEGGGTTPVTPGEESGGGTSDPASGEEPTAEEPVVDPAVEEPTVEEPTPEEPTAGEPIEDPTAEEPTAEEPTTEDPAEGDPTADAPAADLAVDPAAGEAEPAPESAAE